MEQLTLRGTLKGHNGWVTQIATTPQDPNQILSASRGIFFFAVGSNVAWLYSYHRTTSFLYAPTQLVGRKEVSSISNYSIELDQCHNSKCWFAQLI